MTMQGTMLIYRPELPAAVHAAYLVASPGLDALQEAVGGNIELVPCWSATATGHPCVAFCNEDGRRLDLPFNRAATDAWGVAFHLQTGRDPGEVLLGNVVLLTGDDEFMRSLRDAEDGDA